jgi:phenylalanyl-tRNA synthetase alpha chain
VLTLHEYETKLLSYLKNVKSSTVEQVCESTGLSQDAVLWAIENLKAKEEVNVEIERGVELEISVEALGYENEFPEQALIKELKDKAKQLDGSIDGIALSWAKRNGWVEISKGMISITDKGRKALDYSAYAQSTALKIILSKARTSNDRKKAYLTDKEIASIGPAIKELEHRKLITEKPRVKIASISITPLGLEALSRETSDNSVGRLNREMIKSGSWKELRFRSYDVKEQVMSIYPARRHPMKEFIELVRRIWISQGFIETHGPVVESSFWNFDALFSPQDHPTRDMQDTFFLSNPEMLEVAEKDLLEQVAKMHKKGWKSWNYNTSSQPVLRTHTTSVSAHNIKDYGKGAQEYPIKLFSIGKVFRNESIDYKHLAELHQLDGIIIGKGLGVSNLKSTLEQFYARLGFKVKFKPSYFPFVEPGLEASYYDEEHGDWIELCGGGIIRKEITKALGTDMRVIAWGAGLDRLMFRYIGISSLSEMYKNDIGWLRRRRPIRL